MLRRPTSLIVPDVPSAVGRRIPASRISDSADISAISKPANFTDSDSRRRRLPWQSGHSVLIRYWETRFLVNALWVLAKVCRT